ncbi:MAG TPA: DUF6311 domain-containing protein [Paucimonas sp.]|nr:DUF6311 domain-containing protein [Paucimonas sp.]HJW54825.1 DUF6311 domain-containing protein [Burkholderiaceae bacterium]
MRADSMHDAALQRQDGRRPSASGLLSRLLWSPQSPAASYGWTILAAILFIFYLFPVAFLAGNGAFFSQTDASSNVAGWLFYARDAWHFPLLHTERLNHPEGVSIAFTDSIPLAALLFKPFVAWLPMHFHYFGLWHAAAFIAQAIGATFLIRALGVRHAPGAVAAVAFAITWPALLWRIGHTSLMTHGILLFALAFYFLGRRGQWPARRTATAFIILCIIGLTIHPYFLAFCYPLFLAFLVDQALAGEGWRKQMPRALASVAAIAAVGMVLGYFGHGSTMTFGFGYYSMNLMSPFCGGYLVACTDAIQHQFGAFRFADATGGQYEGYNHFGAGMLLLLPVVLITRWRSVRALPKRYPALLLVLVLFSIYALSTAVYFGAHEVAAYSLPSFLDRLTGTFRASGRFFWIVGYAIAFGVLAGLLSRPSRSAILLLAVALPLQWLDVQPLRQRIVTTASVPAGNDLAEWEDALMKVDKIHLYPAFGCGGDSDVNIYWLFQRLAAHYGKLIDTGYFARPNVDCGDNAHAFAGKFMERHLYVTSAEHIKNPFTVPAGFLSASQRGECVKRQNTVLCQPGGWHGGRLQAEPLGALSARVQWPAAALPTQIGHIASGRLTPIDRNRTGFLSFGPYITLPPGRYHYAIDYASASKAAHQAGRWDLMSNDDRNGMHEIGAGPLSGTGGATRRIEGEFVAEDWKFRFEIRTFFTGGDLQVIGLALEKKS